MKKVLVIGKNSYIGDSFADYCKNDFVIDIADSFNGAWKTFDFSQYDCVYHVAGIAHVDTNPSMEQLYYKINRDLAIEVAEYAKEHGAKQFIFMSSMIIYGKDGKIGKEMVITTGNEYAPENAYGKSKLEADLAIQEMTDDDFKTVIIRTPVVYGPNCKGNFPRLIKLAKICPILPNIRNERSMIYIDNLLEFIKIAVSEDASGVFYPQNSEYADTVEIIKTIRRIKGKKTYAISLFNPLIKLASRFIKEINKVFGNKVYSQSLSGNLSKYNVVRFEESIKKVLCV